MKKQWLKRSRNYFLKINHKLCITVVNGTFFWNQISPQSGRMYLHLNVTCAMHLSVVCMFVCVHVYLCVCVCMLDGDGRVGSPLTLLLIYWCPKTVRPTTLCHKSYTTQTKDISLCHSFFFFLFLFSTVWQFGDI